MKSTIPTATEQTANESFTAGMNYGLWLQDVEKEAGRVDIARILTRSLSIPSEDYASLVRRGIEPDPQSYWQGYNSSF